MLSNKNILIGITGGIAAYKALELIRLYKKANADVKVILTENAANFVTPLSAKALSNNPVYMKQFEAENLSPEHISLCDWADIFILAPASANTISKIACGICDNLLTSVICAFKKPVIIAPAMNCGMWDNQIIQNNIKKLEQTGYYILQPETGFLACGTEGKGRLCALEKIVELTEKCLTPQKNILAGKKVVITAGGTKENLDPVRYIGNHSSGKMGTALADIAFEMGGEVTFINTFNHNGAYKTVNVSSADEMQKAVEQEAENADCIIMAAAVADFKAKNTAEQKIKKENTGENLTIELTKNPDILKEICNKKKNGQIIIGFCAESENLLENAKKKIDAKNCDYIIANDISRKDTGFSSDENEVYIIDKNHEIKKLEKNLKRIIAREILEHIYGKS